MASVVTLGPLEREVMDVLWCTCPCSVRAVYERLNATRPIAYTTVMTVMTRLMEKGLLCREKEGKAHLYSVCCSRSEIARLAMKHFLHHLFTQYGEEGVKAFAEELTQRSPEEQQKLHDALSGAQQA